MQSIAQKPVSLWIITLSTGPKPECWVRQDAKQFMTEMAVLATFAKNP
jgi:hypothetical protein